MERPNGVDPALVKDALENCAALRLHQRIVGPRCAGVNIEWGRHDAVVACQNRYIEAAIRGVLVGCLHAPNGNPQPSSNFTYKPAWLERLNKHAANLIKDGVPARLCSSDGSPGSASRLITRSASLARIATPFQVFSPFQTAW